LTLACDGPSVRFGRRIARRLVCRMQILEKTHGSTQEKG
jgi:hypothetical protein